MATALGSRPQLQILHDYDSCCFRAEGLFTNITRYGEAVRNAFSKSVPPGGASAAGSSIALFRTVVTEGNFHQVNLRDKVIVATVLERYRNCKKSNGADGCWSALFDGLPFNLLA